MENHAPQELNVRERLERGLLIPQLSEEVARVAQVGYTTRGLRASAREDLRSLALAALVAPRSTLSYATAGVRTGGGHGNVVHVLDDEYLRSTSDKNYEHPDAVITKNIGIPLFVSASDCGALALIDQGNLALGTAHSGWRGTCADVVGATIASMHSSFGTDPESLFVYIGPYADGNRYRIRRDVYDQLHGARNDVGEYLFTKDMLSRCILQGDDDDDEHWYFDNGKLLVARLITLGLREENILVSGHRTMSEPNLFRSHRTEGMKSKGETNYLVSMLLDNR